MHRGALHLARPQVGVAGVRPDREGRGAQHEHDGQFHEGRHGTILGQSLERIRPTRITRTLTRTSANMCDSLRGDMENPPGRVRRADVGFGGNLGDPAITLREAAAELARRAGPLAAASPVYRSSPMGVTDQPAFLNAVAAL